MRMWILFFLLMPLCATARLGETKEQLEKRYGKSAPGLKSWPGMETFVFEKDGIKIHATILEGVCQWISYESMEKLSNGMPRLFTEEEKNALIVRNVPNRVWEKGNPEWKMVTTDREYEYIGGHSLIISTRKYWAACEAASAKGKKPTLPGF